MRNYARMMQLADQVFVLHEDPMQRYGLADMREAMFSVVQQYQRHK